MGAVLEQNLGQIRSKNGIETFIINKVFHILPGEYLLKQIIV